jgi:branched-chain amino acid transport system substrate-binding protein
VAREPIENLLSKLDHEHDFTRRGFMGLVGGSLLGASAMEAFLAACGGSAPAPQASSSEPFNLAVIQPQTGALVASYAPQFVGMRIAIDEINKAGGILGRQIKTTLFDDQGAAAQQPQVAQNILDGNFNYVLGPIGSSQSIASLQVIQRHKVIQCPQGADPPISDPTKNPYGFSMTRRTDQEVAAMLSWLAGNQSVKKIAVMYENTAYGQSGGPTAVQAIKDKGLTLTTTEVYEQNSASLASQIARVKASGAEAVIWYAAIIPDTVKGIINMVQADYKPWVLSSSTFIVSIAKSAPASTPIPADFLPRIHLPAYKSFLWSPGKKFPARMQAYLDKINADPNSGTNKYSTANAPFYDWLYVLKHVIEQAKSFDPDKVKTQLENLKDFQGLIGKFTFTKQSHLGIVPDDIGVGEVTDLTAPESMGFLPKQP